MFSFALFLTKLSFLFIAAFFIYASVPILYLSLLEVVVVGVDYWLLEVMAVLLDLVSLVRAFTKLLLFRLSCLTLGWAVLSTRLHS